MRMTPAVPRDRWKQQISWKTGQRERRSQLVSAALLLGLSLLFTGKLAQAKEATPGVPERPHVDLIVIIDTSESMVGAGGSPVIFPAVKEAAKQLVEWCEPGDSIVLMSYDEKVRKQDPVSIRGGADTHAVNSRIGALKAKGLWTYTAAAISDALEQAQRLDEVEKSLPEGPHVKMIVLFTDGINDPPPYIKKGGAVSLAEVAKRYSDMPWFVWQVQVGPEIDREVESAGLPGYQPVQARKAPELMAAVREQILKRMEEKTRRWSLRLDPAALDFAAMQQGQHATKEIHLVTNSRDGTGHVRLKASTPNTGVRTTVVPEDIAIQAGQGVAQVSIELTPDAPLGSVTGLVTAEVTDGALDLKTPAVTWTATVGARPHAVRFEPATLNFANLHPGGRVTKELAFITDPRVVGGLIRIRADTSRGDSGIAVDPADVEINADGRGQTKVTLAVAPTAAAGPRTGRLTIAVAGGALELNAATIDWSTSVEWSPIRLEPASLDFGKVRAGKGDLREVKLLTTAEGAAGKVRLRPEGVPAGIQVSVIPEEVSINANAEGRVQVAIQAEPSAPTGAATGRVSVELIEGAYDVKNAAITWSATIQPPPNPLRTAAWIVGIAVLLIGGVAAAMIVSKPKLSGTLRYWQPGVGSVPEVNLEPFGRRPARISGEAGSAICLAELQGKGATIRAAKREGITMCVVQADDGSSLQFQGNSVSQLELYDHDEFSFGGYTFEYVGGGQVPTRPGQV